MVEELGDQPLFFLFAILISFYLFCTIIRTPSLSLLLLLLTFIACRYNLNTDLLISLLDSLGDDLRSPDHFYTIISLALNKTTLESS